jgi:hypothetical protein
MPGSGTKKDPWVLKMPPGSSEYQMYRDDTTDPPSLVCQVGSTKLSYDARALDDLHAMLRAHGGWYGLRKGYRGRFGMYVPPLLEELGLGELTHEARNNRMRAL